MTEHVDIADGERHEPKGASTATSGQVYVSDGAASGSWTKPAASNTTIADSAAWFTATDVEAALAEVMAGMPGGWEYSLDNGAAGQVFNTTAAKLSINGSGTASDSGHLPLSIRGSSNLWNTSTDKIVPVALDDVYQCRLVLPVSATATSPTELTLELDVSSGSTPTTVHLTIDHIDPSHTAPWDIVLDFSVHVNSDFNTNGGQFFLKTDTGTVTITGPSILLTRIHNGNQ